MRFVTEMMETAAGIAVEDTGAIFGRSYEDSGCGE